MSDAKLEATYGIPNFTLPGADVTFFSAMETLSVTKSKAAMSITAESPSDCFNQKFSFSVSSNGTISADVDANKALSQLTPAGFAKNITGCAKQGAALAGWVLKTGDKVLGFAGDELMKAATPIFGGEAVATAAKVAGYPRDVVAGALGKVLSKDELLDIGQKVYGSDQVAAFGKEAGYAAEDFFNWTNRNLLARIGVRPKLGSWADIGKHLDWFVAHSKGIEDAGKLIGTVWPKDEMLDAGKKVYDEGWGGGAHIGKAAGYSAEDVTHYFYARGVDKKEIADVLEIGGYATDQAVGAMKSVYHMSQKEAENLWDDIEEGGKKTCKTLLGWTKIC